MTEAPAAIKAAFADFRIVKGRKVASLIFEVPLEGADEALRVLGGIPQAVSEVWCGIARLNGVSVSETKPTKEKRQFAELPITQQIGIICNEPRFWRFLEESYANGISPVENAEDSAAIVRAECRVESRSQIKADDPHWNRIYKEYEAWKGYVP